MEETEALCTRMGIMVNGELKCLGSLQHLKSVYGDGYTLLVKINAPQQIALLCEQFIQEINEKFPNSILKENRDGFVNLQIKDNSIRMLGSIFNLIEEIKTRFSIEYYFVTQTKLEQIFLNFASRQIDPSSRFIEKKKKSCRLFKCFS
jgi:ABC-type multidrug transport system ATPase subunit